MKKYFVLIFVLLCLVLPGYLFAFPSVFPHGTTIFHPDKTYSGYTILTTKGYQAILIDMNGKRCPSLGEYVR